MLCQKSRPQRPCGIRGQFTYFDISGIRGQFTYFSHAESAIPDNNSHCYCIYHSQNLKNGNIVHVELPNATIPRLVVPGHPHHVTQRGNRRQRTFFNVEDYQTYTGFIITAKQNAGCNILALLTAA
jgi:hypothetical protein